MNQQIALFNMFNEFLKEWQKKTDILGYVQKLPQFYTQITRYLTNLFTGCHDQSLKLNKIIHKFFQYQKIEQKKRLCAKIFGSGDYAFFCLDCQKQAYSVQCIQCFSLSNHKGHVFQKRRIPGGCCDCGDDDKWESKGFCKNHSQVPSNYTQISIRNQQKEVYVNSLKFLLNIVKNIQGFQNEKSKDEYICFLNHIGNELNEFNKNNIKGNVMTAALLLSKFEDTSEDAQSVLSFIAGFCDQENYQKMRSFYTDIHDLLINLFNVPNFKKELTRQYIEIINKKPKIMLSFLSNIATQLFTSSKIFIDLYKEGRLPLIDSSAIKELNIGLHYLFKIYEQFFQNFQLIYTQTNSTTQQCDYLLDYFSKLQITKLSGYEQIFKQNTDFYQVQYLYITKCIIFFRLFSSHQNSFKLQIQSLLSHIKNISPSQSVDLFIPKQRTLSLILFILSQGNVSSLNFPQLLAQYNITPDLIFKMLQSVLKVIRFYALSISNMQTVERYQKFYSFCLNKKTKTLSSLDFQLLKFCLMALNYLEMDPIQGYCIEPNLPYEAQFDYKTNRLPLDILLKLPGLMAKAVIQLPPINDQEGAYDRKKALMYFTDYIGILHEVTLSNIPELHLKSVFEVKSQEDQMQFIEFYGRLLKSIDYVKFDKFKEICQTLLGQKNNYLEKFVKVYCKIENQWISLKQGSPFEEIDLSYYRSLKSCQLLTPFYEGNSKKSNIGQLPSNRTQHSKLRQTIFNASFVQTILEVGHRYLSLFDSHREIFMVDLPHFQKFLQQVIKLVKTSEIKQLNEFIGNLTKSNQLMESFSEKLRLKLLEAVGEKVCLQKSKLNGQASKQKIKSQQAKAQKIRKFKERQEKAIQNMNQFKQVEEKYANNLQCIVCKSSKLNEPLSILCYLQPSNLFSQVYLEDKLKVNIITTCNHYGHKSCLSKSSNSDKYMSCQICKNTSNLLVPTLKCQEPIAPSKVNRFGSFGGRPPARNRDIQIKYPADMQNIETIVLHILYGAIVDFSFFVHSLSKPTHYLFVNIQRDQIQIEGMIQKFNNREKKSKDAQICWSAYKYTFLAIVQELKQQKGFDIQQYEENIPPELLYSLKMLISSISSFEKIAQLENIGKQFKEFDQSSKIHLFNLPQTLLELSSYMGQCPNCEQITNQIYICLLCRFQTCLGCKVKNLTKHTLQNHVGANVFVRVDQGILCYVTEKRFTEIKGLYENFGGEAYQFLKENKKKDYGLNKKMLSRVKNHIVRHRIDQQIRLNKGQFNNQSHS